MDDWLLKESYQILNLIIFIHSNKKPVIGLLSDP